jgi:hypothetical protein
VNTFTPSIDWSHELVHSAVWAMQTFVIAAVCVLAVLVLIGRFTEWGRQFWRVSGRYFTGRHSVPVWALLAVLLVSSILSVRISVLLSYQVNDLFTALQVAFSRRCIGKRWQTRLLVDYGRVRRAGDVLRRQAARRLVRDAAVPNPMANMAEPPLH